MCSAVLHGSMTPLEIIWELPLAFGRQICVLWWETVFDPMRGGIACMQANPIDAESWRAIL